MLNVLNRDPGRIRALHDLTGGNPRTLVLLYLLLELDAEGDVFSDLERLLDQVTVLYKARVEDLAPQARVVLDAVALAWNPITAADVAAATALDTSAVSTQLDRLQKNGVVEKVSLSSTARAGFQLGERFFNIWYLMRHGPRRQKTRLRWLTGFLRSFYSPAQLTERALELLKGSSQQGLECGHYAMALRETVGDEGLRNLLTQKARAEFERFAAASGKRLEEIVDLEDLRTPSTAQEWFGMGWLLWNLGRHEEAVATYRKAIALDPKHAASLAKLGSLLHYLARYDEAEVAYRKAIEINPKYAHPWYNLSPSATKSIPPLRRSRGRYPESYRARFKGHLALAQLGLLLLYYLDRPMEAETAYLEALRLEPDDLGARSNLLAIYLIQPDYQSKADAEFDDIVAQHPQNGQGLLNAIRALVRDNFGEATDALEKVFTDELPDIFVFYQGFLITVLRLAAARGYGDKLLAWLDEQGYADRYWPLRAAFDAYLHGEAKLMDVNPEVRGAAKRIYDWLASARRAQAAITEETGQSVSAQT